MPEAGQSPDAARPTPAPTATQTQPATNAKAPPPRGHRVHHPAQRGERDHPDHLPQHGAVVTDDEGSAEPRRKGGGRNEPPAIRTGGSCVASAISSRFGRGARPERPSPHCDRPRLPLAGPNGPDSTAVHRKNVAFGRARLEIEPRGQPRTGRHNHTGPSGAGGGWGTQSRTICLRAASHHGGARRLSSGLLLEHRCILLHPRPEDPPASFVVMHETGELTAEIRGVIDHLPSGVQAAR